MADNSPRHPPWRPDFEADLLPAVLEVVGALVVVLDRDGRIAMINRTCESITGYRSKEVLGRFVWDLFLPPEEIDEVKAVFAELRAGNFPNRHENDWLTKDGHRRRVAWSNTALVDDDNAVSYVVGTGIDVTERKHSEDMLRRRADDLTLLYEVASVGAQETETSTLIDRTMELLVGEFESADLLGIGLVDEAAGALRIVEVGRDAAIPRRELTIELGRGVVGRVTADGEPRRIDDVLDDSDYLATQQGMRSELCVPMKSGARVIGVLNVEGRQPNAFTVTEERLLMACAGQLATAVEKAHLFAEVHQLAITDALTGLANRRHLFELADREFERSHRHHRPLAALMIDVDDFKVINDTFGHQIGDRVLASVSAGIRDNLRRTDIIGRYGGEEFLVLLPETGLASARMVAEQIRRRAEIPLQTGRGEVKVTLSIGVARRDDECLSLDALLQQADDALLAAKRGGKNQIAVATSR